MSARILTARQRRRPCWRSASVVAPAAILAALELLTAAAQAGVIG